MTYAFQPRSGAILVEAEVSGPAGKRTVTLVLDTGATSSTLSLKILREIGYEPATSTDLVRLTAGTGLATVPRMMINRLSALGRHAIGLRVMAHDHPAEAKVDGLLGLDFFRDLVLTLDFPVGQIGLA